MNWREAKKLVDVDLKKAIIQANDEGDFFRVDYLKYCKKQIRAKLLEFKTNQRKGLK